MSEKKGVTVRIDLYNENNMEDMWEAIIFGLTKEEIRHLYNDYSTKYDNDEFDGAWEDFLKSKGVEWKFFFFDLDIRQ